MKTTSTLVLTIATTLTAIADSQPAKLDLAPIVVVSQPLPSLRVDSKAKPELNVSINNGVGLDAPFVNAGVQLGSISVGPKTLNVTAGNNSSVTVGPVTVGQTLPSAIIGTSANKDGWLSLTLKDGVGITLPFLKLNIPCPTLNVEKNQTKTTTPAKK